MPDILKAHEPLLVNALGHSAGALLFGIFLFLVLQDWSGARLRGSRLSITAASLAFLWNFASLCVMAAADQNALPVRLMVAVSSFALSLLPAVLMHLSLGMRFRRLVAAGYGLSAIAAVIHSSELFMTAPHHHVLALNIITAGFGVLTILSAILLTATEGVERRRLMSRILGAMSLFLFALSFVHYGTEHAERHWSVELVFHHAGIPLALFILMQDFRFVFADAFIRFLANILLAAAFTFAAAEGAGRIAEWNGSPDQTLGRTVLLAGLCLLLILFALARTWVQYILTKLVFRRPDYDQVLREIRAQHPSAAVETEYLDWAVRRLAMFMSAEIAGVPAALSERLEKQHLVFPALVHNLPELRDELESLAVEAIVPMRLSESEVRFAFLGRRHGGRRYLSEDLTSLSRLAAEIVEHVEHFRRTEMRRLVSQAELRALQSQIHPHFLFNALNTLYGVIPKQAAGARRTVLNLADIFRYFLQSDRTYIPLEEELNIVRAYLEIESLRLGPKLRTKIEVDPEALPMPIPILTIQPLVENAVRHGVAPSTGGGEVRLAARLTGQGLSVKVSDTGTGFRRADEKATAGTTPAEPGAAQDKGHGVGLDNVSRRLKLCYGPDAELKIESGPEGATVGFLVPAGLAAGAG